MLLCRGQGEALNIDRQDMYARLYACIPELAMLPLQPDDGRLDHLLSQGKPCLDHLMSVEKLTLSGQLHVSLKFASRSCHVRHCVASPSACWALQVRILVHMSANVLTCHTMFHMYAVAASLGQCPCEHYFSG